MAVDGQQPVALAVLVEVLAIVHQILAALAILQAQAQPKELTVEVAVVLLKQTLVVVAVAQLRQAAVEAETALLVAVTAALVQHQLLAAVAQPMQAVVAAVEELQALLRQEPAALAVVVLEKLMEQQP